MIIRLSTILSLIFLVSCETLPPGDAPQGPVVEPMHIPINSKIKKNEKDALNFMMTSLVSKCLPVTTASSKPSKVINEFSVCENGRVNYLPMELWQNLIKINLIAPVTEKNDAEYILLSELSQTNSDEKEAKFIWKMKMTDAKGYIVFWDEEFEFSIAD
jgi:hypothetical protein